MTEARPAATVIIVRDGHDGPEVLMLRRSRRAGFFPNAWVFPGGRVDEDDARVTTMGTVDGSALTDECFAVAALRECFEEAGVWLGQGEPRSTLRDELNARSTLLSLQPDLVADLSKLAWFSWWITPEQEPKRYDTRFFVVVLEAEESGHATPDQIETVESLWVTPTRALLRHRNRDDFFLAPPTYRSLQDIETFTSAAEIWSYAHHRRIHPIMPKIETGETVTIVLPGDPEHPSDWPVEGATRLALRDNCWVEA